jgi:hypothetical protein
VPEVQAVYVCAENASATDAWNVQNLTDEYRQ